jgi:hypothetical protein
LCGGVRFGALCKIAASSSSYMMWQCSYLLFPKKKDMIYGISGVIGGSVVESIPQIK